MESGSVIESDISKFEDAVKNLSAGISSCGMRWRDDRFSELTQKVSGIAGCSRSVLASGSKAVRSLNNFYNIAAE